MHRSNQAVDCAGPGLIEPLAHQLFYFLLACASLSSGCSASSSTEAGPNVGTNPSSNASGAAGSSDTPNGAGDSATGGGAGSSAGQGGQQEQPPPGPPGCGLAQAAFCDTFDAPSPGGNAGDLDDTKWSVARIAGGDFVQGALNPVGQTVAAGCGKADGIGPVHTAPMTGALPPNDLFICSGGGISSSHLGMSMDDHGGFDVQSMRIRQPFDFTDRTGIIAFDLDGQGTIPGGHGFWWNVFISAEPVPAPYQDGTTIALYAKAGVAIEFEGGGQGFCMGENGLGTANTVSNIFLEKDYAITAQSRNLKQKCFATSPPSSMLRSIYEEKLNHIEIHLSKNKIEVFASDPGDAASAMQKIVSVDSTTNPTLFPLPLSRGYVSFQQTHYNASKFSFTDPKCIDPNCTEGEGAAASCAQICKVMPSYHTYHWDNVAFDGPVLPTPRAYEVPDTLTTDPNDIHLNGAANTGWLVQTNGMSNDRSGKNIAPVSFQGNVDLTGAKDAALTFNAWFGGVKDQTIGYRFNGGTWRTFTPPFSTGTGLANTILVPVDIADLASGANTLEMKTGSGTLVIANLELALNVP